MIGSTDLQPAKRKTACSAALQTLEPGYNARLPKSTSLPLLSPLQDIVALLYLSSTTIYNH